MKPQSPAPSDEPGAGFGPPTPGFPFANKRKISTDGSAAPAESGQPADPTGAGDVEAEAAAAPSEIVAEPDANELLAAERLADLQRLQAEYANYRKRVDRDRATSRDLAIASMIESLLPVLDDIHLARQHGDLEAGPLAGIADKLEATLAKYGVERFGEPGAPFDPSVHDALMHVEEELAEGIEVTTVVGVLQPGYRIGDRVVRPARVSVADPR
jgi:molecular chaperone GrpE